MARRSRRLPDICLPPPGREAEHSFDPTTIPEDVLYIIFMHGYEADISFGSLVCQVCSRWRDVAVAIPHLWSTITTDSPYCLVWFTRSGATPINLTIVYEPRDCDWGSNIFDGMLLNAIRTNMTRVRSLTIDSFSSRRLRALSSFLNIGAPMLEILKIYSPRHSSVEEYCAPSALGFIINAFAEKTPRLTSLSVGGYQSETVLPEKMLRQLSQLVLVEPKHPESLLIWPSLINLRRLRVLEKPNTGHGAMHPFLRSFHFPYLEELSLRSVRPSFAVAFISQLQAGALRYVSVDHYKRPIAGPSLPFHCGVVMTAWINHVVERYESIHTLRHQEESASIQAVEFLLKRFPALHKLCLYESHLTSWLTVLSSPRGGEWLCPELKTLVFHSCPSVDYPSVLTCLNARQEAARNGLVTQLESVSLQFCTYTEPLIQQKEVVDARELLIEIVQDQLGDSPGRDMEIWYSEF